MGIKNRELLIASAGFGLYKLLNFDNNIINSNTNYKRNMIASNREDPVTDKQLPSNPVLNGESNAASQYEDSEWKIKLEEAGVKPLNLEEQEPIKIDNSSIVKYKFQGTNITFEDSQQFDSLQTVLNVLAVTRGKETINESELSNILSNIPQIPVPDNACALPESFLHISTQKDEDVMRVTVLPNKMVFIDRIYLTHNGWSPNWNTHGECGGDCLHITGTENEYSHAVVTNSVFDGSGVHGIIAKNLQSLTLINCTFVNCSYLGLLVNNVRDIIIINCIFRNNAAHTSGLLNNSNNPTDNVLYTYASMG